MERLNKKINFNYDIIEKVEAGIVLRSSDVKFMIHGKFTFNDSAHCYIKDNEVFLTNVVISNSEGYNGDFKLLLSRKQIVRFSDKVQQKGFTIVPSRIYIREGTRLVKVEVCLCRGLQQQQKRSKLKERDIDRQTNRELANY